MRHKAATCFVYVIWHEKYTLHLVCHTVLKREAVIAFFIFVIHIIQSQNYKIIPVYSLILKDFMALGMWVKKVVFFCLIRE